MDQDDVVRVPENLAEFIPQYLESRRAELEKLELGLQNSDFELIKKICHSVKGHAKGYGFHRLQEIVSQLEESALRTDQKTCTNLVTQWKNHLNSLRVEVIKGAW